MTKIKRWVLVLSSVTIGSLRGSGFATWKISNSIKNETSFDVNADGDVSENGNTSFIRLDTTKGDKNSGIELPRSCSDGFYGNAIVTPDKWSQSNSDILGYPILNYGYVRVYLKAGHPHGNRIFTLQGTHSEPTAKIYCEYRNAVPEVSRNGTSLSVDSKNFNPPKKSPTKNSYDFDGKIDVSSFSAEANIDFCLSYKITLSDSASFVTLKKGNISKLTFSFSASFADSEVQSEAAA